MKKNFYLSVLAIALPIALQQILSSAGGMIDNLMVGNLGIESIAAVGAINRFVAIFWCSIYGITSGGASFISQLYGRNDKKGIQRIMGLTLFFNFIIAGVFSFVSFKYPDKVVGFFTKDIKVLGIAKEYLFYVSFGYFINSLVFTYSFNLRTTRRGKISLFAVIFGQAINIIFNYLLIYGKFGFPYLGVAGAAIATVFSKLVEMVIVLGVSYNKKYMIAGTIKDMFDFSLAFIYNFLTVSIPSALGEILWSTGFAFYYSFFGKISTSAMSAYSMITPFEQIFINVFIGLATASLIMTGEKLGRGEDELAYTESKKFLTLGVVLSSSIGLLVFLFAKKIIGIYKLDLSILEDKEAFFQAIKFLKIYGLLIGIRVFNMICFGGVLKSGGDSIYLLFISILSLWGIGIPFTYMISNLFKISSLVYLSMYVEEFVKAFLIYRRFESKKWIKKLIEI